MAASYLALWSELAGLVPKLPAPLAQTHVQRAFRRICDSRPWSFNTAIGTLNSATMIAAGTVTTTEFSNEITFDATAIAALTPQLSTTPPLLGMQFRVFPGPLYTITSFNSTTGVAILDAPYANPGGSLQSYQVYQAYFLPPFPNVERFRSIVDPNNAYTFKKGIFARERLDRADPQRTNQGQPYYAVPCDALFNVSYAKVPQGAARWEFWPHPTGPQTFICTCQLIQPSFSNPQDTLPDAVPDDVVVSGAMVNSAIPWAMMNAGRFPELQKVNWAVMLKTYKDSYEMGLQKAKIIDDGRVNRTRVDKQRGSWPFPVDADWLQDHNPFIPSF